MTRETRKASYERLKRQLKKGRLHIKRDFLEPSNNLGDGADALAWALYCKQVMGWQRIFKTTIKPFSPTTLDGPPQHDYLLDDGFQVFIRLTGSSVDKIGFLWTEHARGSDYAVLEKVQIAASYEPPKKP